VCGNVAFHVQEAAEAAADISGSFIYEMKEYILISGFKLSLIN
jgi:hypothetical protein